MESFTEQISFWIHTQTSGTHTTKSTACFIHLIHHIFVYAMLFQRWCLRENASLVSHILSLQYMLPMIQGETLIFIYENWRLSRWNNKDDAANNEILHSWACACWQYSFYVLLNEMVLFIFIYKSRILVLHDLQGTSVYYHIWSRVWSARWRRGLIELHTVHIFCSQALKFMFLIPWKHIMSSTYHSHKTKLELFAQDVTPYSCLHQTTDFYSLISEMSST